MAATDQDAKVYQKEDRTLRFTISGYDPTAASEIIFAVETLSIEKTLSASGSDVTAVDSSTIDVKLTETDLDQSIGKYGYRLWIRDSSGNDVVVAAGKMTIDSGYR